MNKYQVRLIQAEHRILRTLFYCEAESEEAARKQAEVAYPGCTKVVVKCVEPKCFGSSPSPQSQAENDCRTCKFENDCK